MEEVSRLKKEATNMLGWYKQHLAVLEVMLQDTTVGEYQQKLEVT